MRTRAPGNNGPDSFPENTERTTPGWIGVDLDGTLAKSVKSRTGEEIGVPIHPMVQLVKVWLAHGQDVRIFTARVNPNRGEANAMRARRVIEAWCKRHVGQVLPITYEKDWDMRLLFDDRARQVERDTGRVFCRHSSENRIAHYKHGTSARALLTVVAVNIAALMLWGAKAGAMSYGGNIVTIGALSLILVYICVAGADMIEAFRTKRILWTVIGFSGATLLIWPLWNSLYPVPGWPGNLWPYIVMIWAVLGGLLVLFLHRRSVPKNLERVSQMARDVSK
jgi:hypothetical protein